MNSASVTRSAHSASRRSVRWGLVGLALCLASCSEAREEKARCNELVKQAQASLKAKQIDHVPNDLSKARQDIEAARSACPDKQQYLVERLDKTLASRDTAQKELRERRARDAERAKAEPLAGFVAWAAKHRNAAGRAIAETTCHPRTDPNFGFCEAATAEGSLAYEVRFWKDAPEAFRFSTKVSPAAVCDDLGLNRVVRSWTSPKGQSRAHCEIYGGVLKGLWALVTVGADQGAEVLVFSREYLRRDDALREAIEREGR